MARTKKSPKKETAEKRSTSAQASAKTILADLNSFSVKDQNEIITLVLSEIKLERMNKVIQSQELHTEIQAGINSLNEAVQAGLNAQPQQ